MIWILIPLAGMALGGFAMWLEHKKETRQLGSSTKDLEREVAALRKKLASLDQQSQRRLQNLEAIVTSREWDDLEPIEAPLRDKFLEIAEEEGNKESSMESETGRIARKLED